MPLRLNELAAIAQKCNIEMTCLIPFYKTFKTTEYNINTMLGYFRRKFLSGDVPTILSNDCFGGRMYDYIGFKRISPMLNNALRYEDFLKICKNPLAYLDKDLENLHLARLFAYHPNNAFHDNSIAFNLGDVEIAFPHDHNPEEVKERWSILRRHINPDRFVYILSERFCNIPNHIIKDFLNLKGEKVVALLSPNYYGNVLRDCPVLYWNILNQLDCVIENVFDLLGWLNNDLQ